MKIAVIIPEFNEGQRAVETVKEVLKNADGLIIVVDDGSINNSYELLDNNFKENKRVVVLQHVINLGKGAAMKTGLAMAWNNGAEAVIFVDADGQHSPKHLSEFEKALESNDLVFGYRQLNKEMPFLRKWGNIFAKWVVRILFGVRRKEFLCGYLGFKKSVYKKIKWSSTRYGVETEIATKVAKNKLSYKEIKIDTIYVDKYKGVTMLDAVKVLFKIPWWYISR